MADLDMPTLEGRRWRFADGTTIPVVSGGDGPLETPAAAATGAPDPSPAAGGQPPPPADPAAAGAAPDAAGDPYDTGAATFDRAYVEKLRKESAGYRTRAHEAETRAKTYEPFAGLDASDVGALGDFAKAVVDNPAQAAEIARAWVETLTPAQQAAAAADAAANSDGALTKADVMALLKEERQAAAVEAAQRDIDAEASTLGFPPGSRDYIALIYEAHTNQAGDLKKAAAAIAADRQKIVDDYLAAKAGQAAGTGTPAPGGASPAPTGDDRYKDLPPLERARVLSRARIDAAFSESVGQ